MTLRLFSRFKISRLLSKTFVVSLISALLFPLPTARAADAFDALAACINKETSTQINIMFLIDSSGSLKWEDKNRKTPGSDPDDKRADIIASSILLLERINQEKDLYFSLTTFDITSPGQDAQGNKYAEYPWTQATPEKVQDASEWTEKIKDFDNGQKTDWAAGLRNAKKKLQEAPASEGEACQAIIWFTDGGIDVGEGPEDLKRSIRELCGVTPGESGIPQESLITSIREAGIHLIGVFLKPQLLTEKNRGPVSLFKPAVLGQGELAPSSLGQGTFTCGEYPVPDSHGQGKLIEVNNTDELAGEFLRLTMQIIEGQPAFDTCQSGVTNFTMDPGIKDAVFLLPSLNWKISIPGGNQVSRQALPAGWNETTPLERFSVLNVPIGKNLVGKWSVNSGNSSSCASVFLDAGVQPRIKKNSTFTAGTANQEIAGLVVNSDGSAANLSEFKSVELSAEAIDNTSQNRERKAFPLVVAKNDSTWSGAIEPYTGSSTASLLLKLDLVTKSGVKLPTIKSAVEVPLVVPDQLCRLQSNTLKLSDLYTQSPARGTVNINGPKQGDCLVSIKSISIKQDPVGRSTEMFKPSLTNENTGEKLAIGDEVLVKQGENLGLEITLSNDITADGKSKGLVLLKTRTADSTQSLELLADLEFDSKVKPPSVWLISLLTLLGLFIPLSLLQLSNFFFARFRMKDIRVANVPVKVNISDGKVTVARIDEQRDFFEDRNFDYPAKNTDSEKSITQEWSAQEIFILRTKLPKNPFGEVSGILEFNQERIGFANEDLVSDFDGKTSVAPLNPNGFWVASVTKGSTNDSSNSIEMIALVTAYLNIDPSSAEGQFSQIKDQLETSEDSWRQLAQLVGTGTSIDQFAGSATTDALSSGQNQSTAAKSLDWDEPNTPSAQQPKPNSNDSANVQQPKEKKGLFRKGKEEQPKRDDSTGQTQSSQVDPDDPWA